jgi:hypothetical protein
VKARLLALALLAAAAAVHVAVTRPAQRQAAIGQEQYRRIRDERRQAQSRVARFDRAEALRRQAAAVFTAPAAEDSVRLVRRELIGSLEGVPVSNVRMSVRPGTGRDQVAAVTLAADGDFEDVVRLSGHLARAGSGLVLRSVSFTRGPSRVGLTVEAVGPGRT